MDTSRSHIAGLTAALALALAAGVAHARAFEKQLAAKPRGAVDIRNVAGSIVIRGWDQPSVSVTADLTGATQRVLVTGRDGRTRVCVTNNASSCSSRGVSTRAGAARLEVRVPRNSEIHAAGVSAGIRSRGIAGAQRLHTVSGDIDAELGSGNDDINSVSGSITLRGTGEDGTLRVANVSGDVSVTHIAGEFEARTVNGRLSAEISSARSVRLHTVSGDIELEAHLARGGAVDTDTVSGGQRIRIVAPAGYSYDIGSFSGSIENCFGQQVERRWYSPGSFLDGTRGNGEGHVGIKSLSGRISLCDH